MYMCTAYNTNRRDALLVCVISGGAVRAGHFSLDEFGVQNPFHEGAGLQLCLITRLVLYTDNIPLQPLIPDLAAALGNAAGSCRGSLAAVLGSRTVTSEVDEASEGLCRQICN